MSWDPNSQPHGPERTMRPREHYMKQFAGDENGVVHILPGAMAEMIVELMCDLRDINFTTLQCTQQVLAHTIELRKEVVASKSPGIVDLRGLRV
jgi:hypothetical protein